MDIDQKYKAGIENMIVDVMINSLERGQLKKEDLPEISEFVLKKIDPIKNHIDMSSFLSELSKKWSIFKNIEMIQKGEIKAKVEEEILEGVLTLAKNGKIEDALQLAKKGTQ